MRYKSVVHSTIILISAISNQQIVAGEVVTHNYMYNYHMAALLRLSASVALIAAFIASSIAQDYDQAVPETCKLPPKRGRGGWRFDFWYYDTEKGDCRWMASRSIYGNANRFVSRAACNAYCKHWEFDPCQAVTCDKSECRAVPRTKCESPNGNYGNGYDVNELGAAGNDCPPDFPVCEGTNGNITYRTPPIPVSKFYGWRMPGRCSINLRENLRPSNKTEFIPRMLVQYRKVDRKCKGMYVYPPAISTLAGQSVESALTKLIEKKNAFYSLEECMSTCGE